MEFTYTNNKVKLVSNFLQAHMRKNNIASMTADQCASLLAVEAILANTKGPKPGFNFREMLRQCRDGVIKSMVVGVYQKKPGASWKISYVS